jgi:hypothetical protein
MAHRFYLAFAPLLLSWLTACVAPSRENAPDAPLQESKMIDSRAWLRLHGLMTQGALIDTLARFQTADEMRAYLRAGLTKNEINYVGFDQVTVAECIDRVVAAAMDDRSKPGSQEIRARLDESLEIYFAAIDEAAVRRTAGAAPCLPFIR